MKSASIVCLLVLALVQGPAPATAGGPPPNTIRVTTLVDQHGGDPSRCSLREAITAANGNAPFGGCKKGEPGLDRILLGKGIHTLTRAGQNENDNLTGDLDITDDLAIVGKGAGKTVIHAGGIDRAIDVDTHYQGKVAGLYALSIRGGRLSSSGGGIWNNGQLELHQVEIFDNVSFDTPGGGGGGIYNYDTGNLLIFDSVIRNNRTTGSSDGGGLRNDSTAQVSGTTFIGNRSRFGGGILNIKSTSSLNVFQSSIVGNVATLDGGGLNNNNGATASASQTTFSGNKANANGGGVANASGTTTLSSVTISGNRADADGAGGGTGGGVHRASGTVNLRNSIIANNLAGGGQSDCSGAAGNVTFGGNVEPAPNDCNLLTLSGDVLANPKLKALRDNGGHGPTHAIPPSSPAKDLIPSSDVFCGGGDGRGVHRPVGQGCDAGAYEYVTCSGTVVNRVGDWRNNRLIGTKKADGFLGYEGNDVMKGRGGNDKVCGGPGNDKLFGQAGNDVLFGQQGKDLCVGGPGKDKAKACERKRSIP